MMETSLHADIDDHVMPRSELMKGADKKIDPIGGNERYLLPSL